MFKSPIFNTKEIKSLASKVHNQDNPPNWSMLMVPRGAAGNFFGTFCANFQIDPQQKKSLFYQTR